MPPPKGPFKRDINNTAASTTQHTSPAVSRERKLAGTALSGQTRNVLSPMSQQAIYPRSNNVAVYY
jgi:hypothetical protein